MRHYPYDKLVCGLVDLQLYADHEPAIALLEKVTDFASRTLDRSNNLADPSARHGLLRRAAGVVHAVGESLPRVSS